MNAVDFDHFPSRLHAVVWRNWNIVEAECIGRALGCDAQAINAIAASMGLPPARPIAADFKKQIYITIIRRNWHLLPIDQLLVLLDMRADEFEFSLKEDDFLFYKLGGFKPECPRIVYSPPDDASIARCNEIKRIVREHFGEAMDAPGEPRFQFIHDLSRAVHMPPQTRDNSDCALRVVYSYFGVFGDPLSDETPDPYPGGLLARLADKGANCIWLHVVLNQLAPGGADFPEFGGHSADRLANLRHLVERASQYGIQVYLYINEPRAMPPGFFEHRAEMAGVREGELVALCTSNKTVINWVRNALAYVFGHVAGLGGVFTITASENLTNCASHGNHQACPRCSLREYADIIADINLAIADGVSAGDPNAKVIVWDWGWHGHGDAPDIIAKLPKSAWLMSVSEWAKPIARGGVEAVVGEYSMSVVGPGPRATRHWALAQAAGLKTVAKAQLNNSWELSAVPWLPVCDLVAQHAANLAQADVDGIMLSWSLGGYPSPNFEIAQAFSENPHAEIEGVLNALAIRRYGAEASALVRKAWTAFSSALEQFPYDCNVLYYAPQQFGPANLLFAKPTGYSATMVCFPYDDLSGWRGGYPQDVFISQFEKVAEGWRDGLGWFEQAVGAANPENRDTALADMRIAKAAYLHFASVANQSRFIIGRDQLLAEDLPAVQRAHLQTEIRTVLDSEIGLAKELFEITQQDSRVGFEASNQYYYLPLDLVEKVINCEHTNQKLSR